VASAMTVKSATSATGKVSVCCLTESATH